MTFGQNSKITIAGAGAIGLYVGGRLAAAGRRVCFLTRPNIVQALWRGGLTVDGTDGLEQHLAPEDFEATADLDAALVDAEIILVTVKSKDTAEMAAAIAKRARKARVVVSFQNGVRNGVVLKSALPDMDIRAGMVPYNVVLQTEPDVIVRRTTQGPLMMAAAKGDELAEHLTAPGLPLSPQADMDKILFSKLLINLNNAINALSGMPLARQMADWRWRALSSACMAEAIEIARAAHRPFGQVGPMNPLIFPVLLGLPNWVFLPLMARMNRIDPEAASSMQDDLRRGRATEIDDLQGEIVRMAESCGRAAPINAAIADLIHEAEALNIGPPGYAPDVIASRCGLQI